VTQIAIRTDGLGKRYRLGGRTERYRTLRDTIATTARFVLTPIRIPQGSPRSPAAHRRDQVWALRDVSLEIRQGEVVGVIGANGAGKTTLLKILSRITEPTEGSAEIRGRVGSLLEVGTGFHPELNGCENIYLNGAILGMRRSEITRKIDEIVEFAGVARFLDTPVKRYSTGMYLRLAFAVAAHLEPEILLVDEVLAVGDIGFQRKCLGKMDEVARGGRAVLFVSHNLAALRSLCTRGVVLSHGRLEYMGSIETAIYRYAHAEEVDQPEGPAQPVTLSRVQIGGNGKGTVRLGDPFTVTCQLRLAFALPGFTLSCVIRDASGSPVVRAQTDNRRLDRLRDPGDYVVEARFPGLWLRPGVYSLYFKLMGNTLSPGKARYVSNSSMLDVVASPDTEIDPEPQPGLLAPATAWSAEPQ